MINFFATEKKIQLLRVNSIRFYPEPSKENCRVVPTPLLYFYRQVAATDADAGRNAEIEYRLVDFQNNNDDNEDDSDSFTISRQTGMIYAKYRLDYEAK